MAVPDPPNDATVAAQRCDGVHCVATSTSFTISEAWLSSDDDDDLRDARRPMPPWRSIARVNQRAEVTGDCRLGVSFQSSGAEATKDATAGLHPASNCVLYY